MFLKNLISTFATPKALFKRFYYRFITFWEFEPKEKSIYLSALNIKKLIY